MNNKAVANTVSFASSRARFPLQQQLDDSLIVVNNEIRRNPAAAVKAGLDQDAEDYSTYLPGNPTIRLEDIKEVDQFIDKEFDTPMLNRMAPHLWLVGTQNHANIAPLHEQLVRNRRIVIAENPELHLVWIDDRAFVKPIPRYLMSHAFWHKYLEEPNQSANGDGSGLLYQQYDDPHLEIRPAILGFMRSWTYLVRHESDFNIAKSSMLIPPHVEYGPFMRFLRNFAPPMIEDHHVSPRYRFGQLRLSRLNVWSKVFLRQWNFYQAHWQYWQYFQTFYAPLLFIFAVFTVVLGAMQVGLTVPQVWPTFQSTSMWFAVVTLLLVALVTLSLVSLYLFMGLHELVFALRAILRKKKKS